jgi:hypothetical protein
LVLLDKAFPLEGDEDSVDGTSADTDRPREMRDGCCSALTKNKQDLCRALYGDCRWVDRFGAALSALSPRFTNSTRRPRRRDG